MSCRFRKNEHVIIREEQGGAFLFDPQTGNLKYMNPTGKEIFLMLETGNTETEMVETFKRRYPEISSEQCRLDVQSFLKQLEENRFIIKLMGG
ncbi:MAG: PqqD family protein [Deltaproteobacteria bacterium]|nr:PqqD family protein [Deltaproteobacteria bacterium]MBW2151151.1 PqqD family protein [Deltaproteobacteria bacterium]